MAFANSISISLLLIVAVSCLMMISAEEEVPSVDEAATGNRQSKQLMIMQLSPASTAYPASYLGGSPYELPLMMPRQSPFIQRYPVRKQQQLASLNRPYDYPLLSSPELKDDREEAEEDEEIPAAWRVHDGIDDFDHLKWWKRRFNRQAVITIIPAATECVAANVAADGFGPCKRATQAPHGTIDVKLVGPDPQSAVIAITANSPVNTRIRLICTDITSAGVFTQTGKIDTIADTPRTEVGFMHIVITSTAANAVVRCSWISYRHYTATYP
ncbi:hypothetical protein DAPPUDRAFT_306144 [Daphnia pulex]|uniref:Uncharacterized protein n=1 Tax=Daphnia pulex TaxID=6669 RepID=E9GVQ3_DAPPU|nr:hypothetical protein DAPPUDRAFT_306144 [Daphnia pulex]|eukprot:EFX76447.1 hypothetical protein DAPPUDRAFT_306144 [Daphnia pulex]